MRFNFKQFQVPIRRYYFEHTTTPSLSDLFFPSAYMGCYEGDKPWLFVRVPGHTLIHDLTTSESGIFKTFQSRTRSYIRKAEKEAVFELDKSPDINEFSEFVYDFAEKRQLTYLELGALNTVSSKDYAIYALRKEGQIILGHMYLCSKEKGICFLLISAASDTEDSETRKQLGRANRLLHWQAMRDFKTYGYKIYDWGGFALNTEDPVLKGINSFKQLFKGKLIPIYHFYSPAYALIKWVREKIKK